MEDDPLMRQKGATVRAAAVQLSPVLFDRDGTTEKVVRSIEGCGREDVRLAVFPETIIPNYPYFSLVHPPALIGEFMARHVDQSVEVPGPVTEAVGTAARAAGTVVVLGVNERDGGSLYNTQLIFDADGSLVGKRRKIMPTFQERMVWGWGDGSGLRTFETAVGRIGALICWEHYMPLARYALIAAGEEIHCSHFPGSLLGEPMSHQIDAAIRHHAMESGAFVVNATCWLSDRQRKEIAPDEALAGLLKGGLRTAIVSPSGAVLAGPLEEGEDMAVAELRLSEISLQKSLLDTVGHYSRPDILRLALDATPRQVVEPIAPAFDGTTGEAPAVDSEPESSEE
jgi:aliphatic nitrilase